MFVLSRSAAFDIADTISFLQNEEVYGTELVFYGGGDKWMAVADTEVRVKCCEVDKLGLKGFLANVELIGHALGSVRLG